jgi:parallel beta-helix repeat protein
MTGRAARRAAWTAAVLVVLAAALVVSAFDTQDDGSAAQDPPRTGAAMPAADRSARVTYTGPHRLHGRVTLRARARGARARIVAVTFLLDGRPLGSDTTGPFALDVDAARLPAGGRRLKVVAVDSLGTRSATRSTRVRVVPGGSRVLTASPGRGLSRALNALARGHVSVVLRPGRYYLPHVELGSGARLAGSGPDTTLVAARRSWSLMTVRGRNVRISDLAIDGIGRAERAVGVAADSHDVRLQRLRIGGILETGIEIWGAHSDVSVQDSTIAGDGRSRGAGVFELGSDDTRDMSVIRTAISGFGSHGINFAQRDYDRPAAALHGLALDNRISEIDDPTSSDGTHEGGIWSGGVAAAIIGNRIRDTGWDGIQTVGSSNRVTIVRNTVARTNVGIYLEHETNNSLIARNAVSDVTTGINVEWRYGGSGSNRNTFRRNTIVAASETGLFVDVAGDRNRIENNLIAGGRGPAVVLQGASDNVVTDNRSCERDGPVVTEQSAHHDNGRAAHSLRNRLARNGSAATCPRL